MYIISYFYYLIKIIVLTKIKKIVYFKGRIKNEEESMIKYYVMPKDAAGQRTVIKDTIGIPVNMEGVTIIELPVNNGYLTVVSRNKEYPDHKVALAVAMGMIKAEDVKR